MKKLAEPSKVALTRFNFPARVSIVVSYPLMITLYHLR